MMSSSSNNNIVDACDVRVSTKETAGKNKESDPSNICNSSCSGGNKKMEMMTMVHHYANQHRPSPSYANCCSDVTGPTWNISPSSNIYHAMASGLVSGSGFKTLQPFDITATSEATQTAFKFPGMAACMGFPFTNAQWKELERQAMIYKYMMASVPVPPDLLFPITRNSSASLGSGLNLIRFSNGGDLEPGRCRRTDGKKWRCSRDVAPDQKYCERHLQRGRPRSRKHVELPANKKKSKFKPNPNTIGSGSGSNSNGNNNFCPPFQFPGSFTQYHHIESPEVANFQSIKEQRCLDWMMKGEHLQTHSSAGAESQHLIERQRGIQVNNSSVLTLHYLEQPLNLNSFTDFSSEDDQFINSELVSLEKQTPRGFIDAWSNGVSNEEHNGNNGAKGFVSSGRNLTLSPLSLSMGGKNAIDEEMGQVLMGLGLAESGQVHEDSLKPPLSSWLKPVPWAASAPGGPLAEVLRPSTVTASGSPSATIGNGDSCIPRATAVSYPSGVLRKTLASFSDSSGSSIPTPATSRTNKPEVGLLWLSQGKLESSS